MSDQTASRRSDTTPWPTSVYRYYDRNGVLIYVGVTSRGIKRNREHNLDKEWWQYVVTQEVDHYPNRAEALERERSLIQRHEPPFNRQHNPHYAASRAAYLEVGAALSVKNAVHMYSLLRRALPIAPYQYDWAKGIVVMRTHDAHQLVAQGLLLPDPPLRLKDYAELGKPGLRLADVIPHARNTLLEFHGYPERVPNASEGRLDIKLASQKKPITFSIERVRLQPVPLPVEAEAVA